MLRKAIYDGEEYYLLTPSQAKKLENFLEDISSANKEEGDLNGY